VIDCVYHFALLELKETIEEVQLLDAQDMLKVMVDGKRLKDIVSISPCSRLSFPITYSLASATCVEPKFEDHNKRIVELYGKSRRGMRAVRRVYLGVQTGKDYLSMARTRGGASRLAF
jgi:hypothetical protein